MDKSLNVDNNFVDSVKLEGMSILKGASQIYSKNFFKFLLVNLTLTISFLVILFFFVSNYSDLIVDSVVGIVRDLYIHKSIGYGSIASLMIILLFWIFFSWLRASYLAIANDYFEKTKVFSVGLLKLVSFMMVELVRLIIFLVGIILLPLLPFLVTRYYISSAVLVAQNEGGINSMLESKEYIEGRIRTTLSCVFVINIFILATIISCGLITNLLISQSLIFWSLNIFLFNFIFLPLHSCARFLLFKKLQQLDGELRVKISFFKRFLFIFIRLLLIAIFCYATYYFLGDKISLAFDEALWKLLQYMANNQ